MGTNRRTALLDGHATFLRLGCLAVIALTTCARPSWGIGGAVCLSADNHVYFILKGTVASQGTQVTSVALSTGNASACAEAPSGNNVMTAFAAGLQGAGASVALLPDRNRTDIIAGIANSSVSCANFNAAANGGSGELDFPDGTCVAVAGACPVNAGSARALTDIHTASGGIPAGVDLTSQSRTIGLISCAGDTTVFPNGQGGGCSGNVQSDSTLGEVSCQNITFDDHVGSVIGNITGGTGACAGDCSVAPTQTAPDGFLLKGNCTADATCQMIVFTASNDAYPGFCVAAAGFKIDASSVVFGTDSFVPQSCLIDLDTPTPTLTSTRTPTATPSPTSTPTATQTSTATDTATVTATRTHTPTPTPTSQCLLMVPAGFGQFLSGNQAFGCSQNWQCETPPDDGDASYVFCGQDCHGSWHSDIYPLTDLTPRVEPISSLTVHIVSCSVQGISGSYASTWLNLGGSTFTGSAVPTTTTYTDISTVYSTNPSTGVAWTWEQLSAVQAGVRQQTALGDEVRTTTVFVEVCWGPPPPTPTPTPTPTNTPTTTTTRTPTGTSTPTRTPTNTATQIPTATPTLTKTPMSTPTCTPCSMPTCGAGQVPYCPGAGVCPCRSCGLVCGTPTPTKTPTNSPTSALTKTATASPSSTPTNSPPVTPSSQVVLVVLPGQQTVLVGQTFDVTLQVQAGTQLVDGAAASLNFDPSVLQVLSISAGSTLPVTIVSSFDNDTGTLDYAAGTFYDFPSGTFTLATATFTAVATTTNTSLVFSTTPPRQSDATYAGVSVLGSTVPATLTVNELSPTATPTSTPTAAPADTSTITPTESATPAPTPTATPTDTPADTPTATPTDTPTATPTDTPTATPTETAVPTFVQPTPTPTCPPCGCAGSLSVGGPEVEPSKPAVGDLVTFTFPFNYWGPGGVECGSQYGHCEFQQDDSLLDGDEGPARGDGDTVIVRRRVAGAGVTTVQLQVRVTTEYVCYRHDPLLGCQPTYSFSCFLDASSPPFRLELAEAASPTPTPTLTATPTATEIPSNTPTDTPTGTPTDTPTQTPTETTTDTPIPTSTPTSTPTETATVVPCVGDCNGDGQVTVNEILVMVNIALGNADATACPNGIPSGAQVDVALILTAVSNALNGCAGCPVYPEVRFQVVPLGQSTFRVDELDAGGVQHTFPRRA